MLRKSIAISLLFHVIIGFFVVYFMAIDHTPSKRKVMPITMVALNNTPKIDSEPLKAVKKEIPKPKAKPKPKVKPKVSKPISVPVPKPKLELASAKPVEEKYIDKSKESVKPVESTFIVPKSEPKISSSELKKIKENYLRTIYQSVAKHKVYPRNARKLGQSGTVNITFSILADGTIVNIFLSDSSGFRMLDDAAKKILTLLEKVTPIPTELNEKSITLALPIEYKIR